MRKLTVPFAVGLTVAITGWLGIGGSLDRMIADGRSELDRKAPSGEVVVVAIDAPSLAAVGTWPWPRSIHADLLDRLREAGVARVGFDVDFSSRSPSVNDDAALVAAAGRLGPDRLALPAFNEAVPVGPTEVEIYDILPFPELGEVVQPVSVVAMPDTDGLVRRLPGEAEFGIGVLPTMAAWLTGRVPPSTDLMLDVGINIGELPHVSYVDVLNGEVAPETLAGKIVLVGATDPSLGDEYAAPRYLALAGVRLHALAAESILQERVLRPVHFFPPWLAGCVAVGLTLLSRRLDLLRALPLAVGLLTGVELTGYLVHVTEGWVLGTALADFTVVASVAVGLADRLRSSSTLIRVITGRLLRQETLDRAHRRDDARCDRHLRH